MADYTPATPQVRAAYVRAMRNAFTGSAAEHEAEFDRWLAGALADAERSVIEANAAVNACKELFAATDTRHAQLKADAWDEGARWAYEEITGEPENRFGLAPGDNPYRAQKGHNE